VAEPQHVTQRAPNTGMFKQSFQPADLLQFLDGETSTKTGKWQTEANTELGISKTTFHRLREALLKEGKIEKKEDGYVISS